MSFRLFPKNCFVLDKKSKTRCNYILEHFDGFPLSLPARVHVRFYEGRNKCIIFFFNDDDNGLDNVYRSRVEALNLNNDECPLASFLKGLNPVARHLRRAFRCLLDFDPCIQRQANPKDARFQPAPRNTTGLHD